MKIIALGIFFIGACLAEPQLKLLNVVFRHGDRTPAPEAIYPTDPYYNSSFYPMGLGGLTNNGKRQVYKLGKYLRNKYKNFLGDVYLPNILSARSTDYERTKMSLQLVFAALFPPIELQKWHKNLAWQPIPFTYVPIHLDDLLGVASQPSFEVEKKRVQKTEFIQNRLKKFEAFISRLEELTGREIKDTYDITKIYDTLYSEWKMNLTLPSWSTEMFPDGELEEVALIDYDAMTYDKNMTYQLAGKLATKVRNDILSSVNKTKVKDNKLYLYSGHEVNVAGTFVSLQIFDKHIPTYASAAIIELYEDNDKHYIKVLYYHGDSSEVEEMQIPDCSILCPLERYLTVVNELIE